MFSLHAAARVFAREERGQASLMMLALVGALLVGAVVLFGLGNALGAKGRYQRAADLAAITAAQVMRATAELSPAAGEAFPGTATGGGYDGPLAYRQGEPMRPDVALAYDRMGRPRVRRRGCCSASAAASGRTRSRRAWSPPTQTRSGSLRPARACTATPPSSTSGRRRRMRGWRRTRRFGFAQRYSWEAWH